MRPDSSPRERHGAAAGFTSSLSPVESDTASPHADEPVASATTRHQPRSDASRYQTDTAGQPGGGVTTSSQNTDALSPGATDRVFPIRSVVSVDPTPTPSHRSDTSGGGYFGYHASQNRRYSVASHSDKSVQNTPAKPMKNEDYKSDAALSVEQDDRSRQGSTSTSGGQSKSGDQQHRHPPQVFQDIAANRPASERTTIGSSSQQPSLQAGSIKSTQSDLDETGTGLITARFKHVVSEGGHAIITGRDGETLQRCEDEPIHIPGAVQGFGLLIAFEEEAEGKLVVKIVSENSKRMIGYSPKQLFALESFTDILSEEQTDNLLDHVDFIRDEDADVTTNGPEVFTMSIRSPQRKVQKLWCAMHINERNPNLVICEFELEDDAVHPLVPTSEHGEEPPEDTLQSDPTPQELAESTENSSRPLRVLRSARKRKGEAAAMEVFNIMSQVQEQLAAAPNLEKFLKILVGVVKELTGFHRVMIYQFDSQWNGRVVTELVDPRATKDLYKGLNFPASDIPKQARDLYKLNKVRMLYDRDQETARLVCRTVEDLETPLDLTYSYLRAMSPIHLKYLTNMAVRSSMSISISAFDELWGLIACHSYGSRGMRVSFPIRKMCRLVGETASRNIERLSYASRLQARKLINTVPTSNNPSGYIIASSDDLLKLFDADFGMLSIRDETKILGHLEHSQEALAMLEYLRMRRVTNVMTSQDLRLDFPDLRYAPGFRVIAGLLLVPLSSGGQDFIVFFRKGQLKEVKWAGNPYEKFIKEGTEGYLEPRKSFRTWSETVVGKCREWTEEEIETAAVLCLVYGKFIDVWRQKEAALHNSQLTRLLLANSAHEVRTPLNAIINYLEIALEGALDQETRENLSKSHSASKSLIYVINDLLDLTKTEEGGELIKEEVFDLSSTLKEATEPFSGDARRKQIDFEVVEHPGLPKHVIGDQRKIRQAISNITANAIQNTIRGGVEVQMYLASRDERHVEVEVSVQDTGAGMSDKKLDSLFRELEQVQSEAIDMLDGPKQPEDSRIEADQKSEHKRTLGLGLAVVARIVRNMNGQMRLKSEENKGSRFVLQFPFDLPDSEPQQQSVGRPSSISGSTSGSETPHGDMGSFDTGEVTLVKPRRSSAEGTIMSRRTSQESVHSKRSLRSLKSNRSVASASSARSEADRLIDAIQAPMETASAPDRSLTHRASSKGSMPRPRLDHRSSTSAALSGGGPLRPRSHSTDVASLPEQSRQQYADPPGQSSVQDQRTPIRAVRMPDELDATSPTAHIETRPPQFAIEKNTGSQDQDHSEQQPPTADHLRVLVAEDDPVNSRIIKKRLDKMGHETYLTTNGEECSSLHGDKGGYFDVVLMDMQMPIVDGLTSTKMIRSLEKTTPSHTLSKRASLNGRIPVIAVSASLLERDRQKYIDAGFDGWILKPISFPRLSEILTGIVDRDIRRRNLYRTGEWERGGWFEESQADVFAADTEPESERQPMSNPSEEVKIAAVSDDPQLKEDTDSKQTQEQQRMAAEQEADRQNDDDAQSSKQQDTPVTTEEGDAQSVEEQTPQRSDEVE
ncbi:hypothetical protein AAFC00_004237 [Neodothiora populina]|uniref:Phytochrome n=1 Tax=Neodothiora populina TaxID=2781224 RepID=A0ABR3PJ00_9PEZI